MIETYLSLERCDGPDRGCPIAALAPDIARTPSAMKQRISAAILKFREDLIPFMPGRTSEEKSSNFLMIITCYGRNNRPRSNNARAGSAASDSRYSPKPAAGKLLVDERSNGLSPRTSES